MLLYLRLYRRSSQPLKDYGYTIQDIQPIFLKYLTKNIQNENTYRHKSNEPRELKGF